MQIVWRFDVAMTMAATIARILAAWILWGAVFTGRELVGGFTFQSMLSYYIVSSFLASLDMSNQISNEISFLIKDGGFSKHMVTPMNPFGFFSFMVAGESAFHLCFSLAAAVVCAVLFQVRVALIANAAQIFLSAAMVLLGLLFMMCFHYFLGILNFLTKSDNAFLFIADHLAAFATGALVPLALLPESMLRFMRLLPFYYVAYLPSMLLTGHNSGEAKPGVMVLSCWVAGFLVINYFSYNKLRVKYDGVGI